jgi:hypothetical protein
MKKLLSILLPLVFTVVCVLAVWANEPSTVQPGCDNCPKADIKTPCPLHAKDGKAVDCDLAMKGKAPCADCAKEIKAAKGCDNCIKTQGAAGKPCGDQGCEKGAKVPPAVKKPCCDQGKP